ncbi:AAA domain-containing protein [Geodermatophilus sp. URMC 62]|uniref:AAA domain-containing protein n=1 Tax=Geodermatophilus sp. URMC 62 TaxID=3423414 RepID=UPI00406C6D37
MPAADRCGRRRRTHPDQRRATKPLRTPHWVDPKDDKPAQSPLLLVPVRLKREAAHEPYVLVRTEDEAVANPALELKLQQDFDLELPELDPEAFDVEAHLAQVERTIRGRAGWEIQRRVVLTTFSFHKEAIYRDLLEHEEQVLAHPMVQLVALGPDSPTAGGFAFDPVSDEDLDQVHPPEQLFSILDADGSQRKCVLAARDGRSFVMDGPPGTGKSQTIANIIVELIAAGRTVLFVSEKAAALDVVRNRLSAAELSPFLLELHSHAATRKQVVMELDKALTQSVTASRQFGPTDEKTLSTSRTDLSAYAGAVNERRPGLGRSLFDVLGRVAALDDVSDYVGPVGDSWAALDAACFSDIRSHGERLARAWRPVSEGADFLWRDLADPDVEGAAIERMGRAAVAARDAAAALRDRATAVDDDLGKSFGASLGDVVRRRDLLARVEGRPDAALVGWLTIDDNAFRGLRNRAGELEQLTTDYKTLASRLSRDAGQNWQSLDADLADVVTDLCKADKQGWAPARQTTATQLRVLVDWLDGSPTRLADMQEASKRLAAMLGMSWSVPRVTEAQRLVGLALLGEGTTPPEAFWLHPSIQAALDESANVLAQLVVAVQEREQALAETFTRDALQLDLAALDVRFRETHKGWRKWSSQARADRKGLRAVTTAGKVDDTVLARLGEAVAWQRAESALSAGEQDHAPRLGSYYRRTQTDFGRVAQAIETAHQAVRLAGEDLNAQALAQQLALGGQQDPALNTIGHRLDGDLRRWLEQSAVHLGEFAIQLQGRTFLEAAEWCLALAERLRPGLAAVEHVAEVVGRDVTVHEAKALLRKAGRVAECNARIFEAFEEDVALLGPAYEAVETDWKIVSQALDWTDAARGLLGGAVPPVVAERVLAPTLTAADLSQRLDEWSSARSVLLSYFLPARAEELGDEFADDLGIALDLTDELAETAARDIEEWGEYVRVRAWLADQGFSDMLEQLEARLTPAEDVPRAIERAALLAWTDATVKSDPALRRYRASDRDALVATFQDLDRRLVADAHGAVVNACSARRPRNANSKAAQIIRREAQKKSRHKPVRWVLGEAAAVVQELKPCFMMSPLSVSQLLPGGMRFDVVIFDEASQVLPSDAVNCIYRGTQLIVAGDQKQLPPTNFFASSMDDDLVADEEEEAPDNFESVLDVCKAAGALPSLPLLWHYRSRHEALITYSNYKFYEGELHTFPGATFEAPDLGVEAFFVNGVYRRGGGRDNIIEAEKVVDRLLHHRTVHPDLSIGVVTFSAAQEDAIQAAIEQRAVNEPLLNGLLNEHDRLDGFFVKSLENVQGDERDVILFSIGYGPDETGKFTMNFGPLNREGGWRRLNVAITRARRRVEVVSSFRASQISGTTSKGVLHLQGYLDFAERGTPALALEVGTENRDAESPFEEDVIQVIRELGYTPVPQVGVAGYRIDIGIRHPDRPGEYVLAVECDGAAYHSAKAARDRDRLRQQVLEGLGWTVHRIWGLSWVRDRRGQIERLRLAIEAAVKGVKIESPAVVAPRKANIVVEDVDLDAPPEWAVPYERGVATPDRCPYAPQSTEARPYLRRYFERLLRAEAPVHEERLLAAFREDWGVGRVGHVIKDNIRASLARATVGGLAVSRDEAGFYRVEESQFAKVRVPVDADTLRSVSQVPPEEIDLAVLGIIGDARFIEDEIVAQTVARLFGWRRQGLDIQAAVYGSISRLLSQGRLARTDDGLLRLA